MKKPIANLQVISKRQIRANMDEAVAKKPQLTGPLARLPWEITIDILGRLPAKSVLWCRCVCKAWRNITSDPGFVAARVRCRPADVVLYRREERPTLSHDGRDIIVDDIALDLLSVSSDEETRPLPLVRYPNNNRQVRLLLLASFNGILMFRKDQGFYLLCNPVTRQWAELPRLPQPQQQIYNKMTDIEHAFYFHANSGEYRLLCRQNLNNRETWWILAVGAAKPRRVDMRAAKVAGITKLVPYLRTTVAMHVALNGRLHWPPHEAEAVAGETEMVVFDMELETFQLMAGPPTTTAALTKVFAMDGVLVAADFGKEEHIDLWFLEDYNSRRWELRHCVKTPWGPEKPLVLNAMDTGRPMDPRSLLSVTAAGDGEGNVMLGNNRGLVVYNVKTNTVKTIDSSATTLGNGVIVSRHVFKENLENHSCFATAQQCSVDLSLFHYF